MPVASASPAGSCRAGPRVAIGLPVRNGERYLAAAIDSLLAQRFGDFELLISDNASTDGTWEICRHYAARDARVRVVRQDGDRGAAVNFNHVFERTAAPLFKWAAHDDVVAPDYLSRAVALLDRRPDAAIAHSAAGVIDAEGRPVAPRGATGRLDGASPAARLKRLLHVGYFTEIFGLIRREVLQATGLHRVYVSSDRILMAELLLRGDVAYDDEVLFLRRDHPEAYVRRIKGAAARARWVGTAATPVPRHPWLTRSARLLGAVAAAPIPPTQKASASIAIVTWHGGIVLDGLGRSGRQAPPPQDS
ncbi:MAG: glycosyltransferase family 2 protein [Azospirillaceae bacterium]